MHPIYGPDSPWAPEVTLDMCISILVLPARSAWPKAPQNIVTCNFAEAQICTPNAPGLTSEWDLLS